MSNEFEGQYSIVTGAARGLGLVTARMMAERGAAVIMADINQEAIEAAAENLREQGLAVYGVALDLADQDQYPALMHAVDEHCGGRVDALVNNAGAWRYSGLRDIEVSELEWIFRVNLTSAFLAMRAVMDIMVAQNGGHIVNVASGAAHRPHPGMPHYAAAKASLVNFTRSFATELAPSQVFVNAVSPGPMATEAVKELGIASDRAKAIPLGHIAEPEDIAEIILFLASRRNRFIVGQTIIANGGAF